MANTFRRLARAARHPIRATTYVSQMMRARKAPAPVRSSAPSLPRTPDPLETPDSLRIFAVIQDALNDHMLGRTSAGSLPILRFPDPPSGPLGKALSRDYGQRDWTEMLARLDVARDGRMLDFGCGAS